MKGKHRLEKLNHTWYLVINASIDGTSSPTNLSIVLYCESSFVHAGEYLLRRRSSARPPGDDDDGGRGRTLRR